MMSEAKHTILVICPTRHDKSELAFAHIVGNYKIIFQEYDETAFERILASGSIGNFEKKCPHHIINQLLNVCEAENITAVFSTDDYPGSIYAAIIASFKGLPGPAPAVVLGCQHKWYARRNQSRLVPRATPGFFLINPEMSNQHIQTFPVFVKPVKSYFSFLAGKVANAEQLQELITNKKMPDEFLYQFNWFLQQYGFEPRSSDFLAETILHGYQVTVEGYVYNGECHILGVIDSIMYPGTISFARFEYPSSLSEDVQNRMGAIAQQIMRGINFNNSFFNIEMMYNPESDEIYIIEVNPRMAAQFADLYEKVDGLNSFIAALDIAVGKRPNIKIKQGPFNVAASCIMRIFENKRVLKIPTAADIAKIKDLFPESRVFICINEGQLLSDQLQDGNSYLYCLLHLGARDRQELLEKFEYAKKLLPFIFSDV